MSEQQITKPKKKRMRIILAAFLVVCLGTGITFVANKSLARQVMDFVTGVEYYGSGSGSVQFRVSKGDSGKEVAKNLVDQGITKSYDSTLRHIYSANPTFYPGVFSMPKQISSDAAIAILTDTSKLVINRITIREGLRLNATFDALSKSTGIPVADFESAAKNPQSLGVPKAAPSLEGYLFPATYDLDPNTSAKDILQAMVDRTIEQLQSDGVAKKDWHKTLTLASIVQVEARQTQDFYKVSRTFLNRIAVGMHLQSDATVSYGVNGSTVSTSAADRANDNGYNTYLHAGLPIGPISAPGAVAIDAALHPAEGKWLYFCAINLDTGETVFSNTYAEHQKAVQLWRQWMLQNPGWNG